jgi:mono/diheme cytochrome c family protein
MVMRWVRGIALAAPLVWFSVAVQPAQAAGAAAPQPSPDAVQAGRRLFLSGLNRTDSELVGQISRSVELTGAAAACVKCHGSDGSGSREGGLVAPSLRWEALSRPRPASAAGSSFGRPAYTEQTLLHAIRSGTDSSGRSLSAAMPRFMLGPREAADLMAYLRVLGGADDVRPGVHADRVVFGTALPLTGAQAARGQAVRRAIEACFDRADREGAVYGRKVVLDVIDSASPESVKQLDALRSRTLALVAPWWPHETVPEQMQPLRSGEEDWPIIAPLWPQPFGPGQWPAVFELHGQSIDQARVLIDTIALRLNGRGRALLIAGGLGRQQAALKAALAQAELYPGIQWQLGSPDRRDASTNASGTAPGPVDAVALLGGLELLSGLENDAAPVFALSTELGRSAFQWPLAQRQRLWLAHAGPLGQEFDPSRLVRDLKASGSGLTDPALQAQAWAGACLSVEALRRSGRTPEGTGLRRALENVSRFETGVLPAISFSPRQRQGIWGARMVVIDARGQGFEEVMPWQTPREEY